MPQVYHFVAEQSKENLMLGVKPQQQHMVAGRLCQYLKSWQLDGLRFLYKNYEKGEACILNDESGLGKVVTVATFLGSILTNDTTKKCLIIVGDDEAVEGWRFHLSVLTQLTVKVIERTSDINFETVHLIKWSTLKNICEIDKVKFDHIIIDNRGKMLNNKFCTGTLLRYFENKITLVISSVDVTSDIKLLHILLRLCGRLDRQYTDVQAFEDKFQLPQLKEGISTNVDLEDYFLKRERVINFCRDFRLRRYCHQFDEEFPIVPRSEFRRHLEQWKNQNSLSSGSVKLLSSSSEKDPEELFKEYFQVKQERKQVDNEVQRINEELRVIDDMDAEEDVSDDLVVMSPLLLVSESESDDDQTQVQIERNSQFIEEVNDGDVETGDEVRNTSKDSENRSKVNRRKSKTPVKTLTKSNDESKTIRSRAMASPKKPLPIHTKSRKSEETDNKVNVVGGSLKRKRSEMEKDKRPNEENTKKKVDRKEKTEVHKDKLKKANKIHEDGEKKVTSSKQKDFEKLVKIKVNKNGMESEKFSKENNNNKHDNSNAKKPEKSPKQKSNENDKQSTPNTSKESPKTASASTHQTKKPEKTIQEKNKKPELESNKRLTEDSKKQDKTPSKQLKTHVDNVGNKSDSQVKKKHIDEDDNNKRQTKVCENSLDVDNNKLYLKYRRGKMAMMLEEAQKFVTNKNIGRRTKKPDYSNNRTKSIEIPKVVIVAKHLTESPAKSVSSPKTPSTPKENKQTTCNNNYKFETPKRGLGIKPLTELAPVGVHSKSTRGMKRQTRSTVTANKYMKIAVAQVCVSKTTSLTPKHRLLRRPSVLYVRKTPTSVKNSKSLMSSSTPTSTASKKSKPAEPTSTSSPPKKIKPTESTKTSPATKISKPAVPTSTSPAHKKSNQAESTSTSPPPKKSKPTESTKTSPATKISKTAVPTSTSPAHKKTKPSEPVKTSPATKKIKPAVPTSTSPAIKKSKPAEPVKTSPTTKKSKPLVPTPPVLSESLVESMQLGQALTPTNSSIVPDFIVPAPKNVNYHFPLMLDRETSDSECQITSHINNNNQEVIILTGSSTNECEMEPPKSTVSRRKAIAKPPMVTIPRPIFSKAKSPDLFSTCSDPSLPCSQQQTNKTQFEGFKIFGSELRQPPAKPRSCLDILERMLEPRNGIIAGKKNTPIQEKPRSTPHQHCLEDEDAMFEITSNGTFGNTVRINSSGDMSPMSNKNQSTPPASGHPKNRITNYLISNNQHTSVAALPPSMMDDVNDLLPKTPKRRKSLSVNIKRSPRAFTSCISGGKSQSTKLTQWLVKNSNAKQSSESTGKSVGTKRRRLDLSFPDK